ncbi:MAG: triose-phosphate isomerase [Planctomycetota bacterium]|jgi:triosephosphate isomerase|nr:triose-phosphate isomerase [Planctomycetota bacterium]MDP6503013.1 triose-phosphate isomerase [Planctomycetota bacterium]
MRVPLAAGNWKMNLNRDEAIALAHAITEEAGDSQSVDVVLCPPAVYLEAVCKLVEDTLIGIGAQDVFWQPEGAYTGEVSAPMVREMGCSYSIVGHSERRHLFGETDEEINWKLKAAQQNDLTPILCVGEHLEERQADQTAEVVTSQVEAGLEDLDEDDVLNLIIAYEPVWAIGTGEVATPDQANEVHALIRSILQDRYGTPIANGMRILYGGSVKPDNIRGLIAQSDIDGALVGGASLEADSFLEIIRGCGDA